MTKAEKRTIKNQIRNAIKEFLRIQAHYFPDLIEDIKNIMDERNANSLDYNAMKKHYLITQIADILMQIYENGEQGVKELKYTIKKISEELLESLRKQKLETEDLSFEKMQVRRNT